jgi:Sigma-70, region 4
MNTAHRSGGLQLTQKEVAVIMKVSEPAVRDIERRAIEKLRNHPALKQIWQELHGRDIDEGAVPTACQLSRAEEVAILALAQTPFERHVALKLLRVAGNGLPPGRKPTVRLPTRM